MHETDATMIVVAPLEQRPRRRVAQPVDLVVARRVLLDVRVGARQVRLGLVVVEVRDEVLDRVLGEELAELAVQLRGERLVVGQDERRPLGGLDGPGDRRGLARAGRAEQRLVAKPLGQAVGQAGDRLGWSPVGWKGATSLKSGTTAKFSRREPHIERLFGGTVGRQARYSSPIFRAPLRPETHVETRRFEVATPHAQSRAGPAGSAVAPRAEGQSLVEFSLVLTPLFLSCSGSSSSGSSSTRTSRSPTRPARSREGLDLHLPASAVEGRQRRGPQRRHPDTIQNSMNLLGHDPPLHHQRDVEPERRRLHQRRPHGSPTTSRRGHGQRPADGRDRHGPRSLPPGPDDPAHLGPPAQGRQRPDGPDRRSHDGPQLMAPAQADEPRERMASGQVLVIFALGVTGLLAAAGVASTSVASTASDASSRTRPTRRPWPRRTPSSRGDEPAANLGPEHPAQTSPAIPNGHHPVPAAEHARLRVGPPGDDSYLTNGIVISGGDDPGRRHRTRSATPSAGSSGSATSPISAQAMAQLQGDLLPIAVRRFVNTPGPNAGAAYPCSDNPSGFTDYFATESTDCLGTDSDASLRSTPNAGSAFDGRPELGLHEPRAGRRDPRPGRPAQQRGRLPGLRGPRHPQLPVRDLADLLQRGHGGRPTQHPQGGRGRLDRQRLPGPDVPADRSRRPIPTTRSRSCPATRRAS